MTWRLVDTAAPELARLGRERLSETRVALLGTLRPDGSPRISPVEPFLSGDELVFGAMAGSAKSRDLARDARCVLHSAVTSPDSGVGEVKLHGQAVEAPERVRAECMGGWWLSHPRETAVVFTLEIAEAVFVSWDLVHGLMTVLSWSPERGCRTVERAYP